VSGNLTADTAPVVFLSPNGGEGRPTLQRVADGGGEGARSAGTVDVYPIIRELLQHPAASNDLLYAHIVWMALEPKLAEDPQPTFAILAERKTVASEVSRSVLRQAMRRIFDSKDGEKFNAADAFVSTVADNHLMLGRDCLH